MPDAEDLPQQRSSRHLRLGYVPLSDCAPIAVARELGIFEKYSLNVHLSRELGWASVRDKIYYGDLDAAQSIAGIAFALGLGFSDLRCEVAVPMILNLHGNAVTLSNEFKPAEIGKGEGLKNHLRYGWKKDRPFTLAATHRFSSHNILLHTWLKRCGLSTPGDVEIVFLPPPLMPRHLQAGHIDGYCVGEPWNSVAILEGNGWCPVTSSELSHGHPEKVLLVSGRYLRENRDDTIGLVSSLLEACRKCQDPEFQEDLLEILAMEQYTGASPDVLRNSLSNQFITGADPLLNPAFHIFHGDSVNRPTVEKASWVLAGLRAIGALPEITAGSLSRIYREDIFLSAQHA
ncbi:MAG: ABC transporter substrate-binding protein [Akkermansiaceae bacterium]|nr:ABC transporter substrate-binding protein [Akkermansiaceae bacterium]MCP5545426.1 ABC transporter substrate-binding protein [Akkermansiaceae bacterium]MCP5547602.1 ABC transporter substrate-binding protein [Akkermansiaceae bacterium]